MTERNMAQALNEALRQALAGDERVLLLGEDVGRTGGVFRISDGLQAEFGPQRVVDTPVAESGIVGAAYGLAVAGMRPVAELQFLGFAYPAFDQLVSHVSRIRHRSRHRFTAPLVVRIPYGGGIGAAEHHSESTEAVFTHTPGLKVVVPSNPADAKGLLAAAIADPDPVIFLEPIRLYRAVRGPTPDEPHVEPLGKAAARRHGDDVTLVAWGAAVRDAERAAEVLAEEGVDAAVVDLRTLVPLDASFIVDAARATGRVVVVAEAHRTAGFAAEVVATIQEEALYSLEAPVARVTGWDTVVPLKRTEQHYIPDVRRIVGAARQTLAG